MKSKPSERSALDRSPLRTTPEEFSKSARSAAEEFIRYCREHNLLPTYELFSKWIAAPSIGTPKPVR